MKKYIYILHGVLILSLFNTGCKKFLDEKTNKKLVVIATLQDLQSLLENNNTVNNKDAGLGDASADNYYLLDADYSARTEQERNIYVWNDGNMFTVLPNDWTYSYDNVYRANVILDNIVKIERNPQNARQWDDIKGQALFLRAKSFFQVAQIFALAFDESSADRDMGVPLRMNPDFNEVSIRSTLRETYGQIVSDLKLAADLLPNEPVHVLRASKVAAYGLVARTYLSMRKYDSCYKYADLALQLKSTLQPFSTLSSTAAFPFAPEFSNPEIIFSSKFQQPALIVNTRAKIDSLLYRSYNEDDLRKKIFFTNNANGINTFKGSYTGAAISFSGIATNEIVLTRAECLARLGDKTNALIDLNALMSKRWNPATFKDITALDANDAVKKILVERRKELVVNGLRWMDIKRLNKEGANIVLKRIVSGVEYTLLPNDLRYALPIPDNVIAISGMKQNLR